MTDPKKNYSDADLDKIGPNTLRLETAVSSLKTQIDLFCTFKDLHSILEKIQSMPSSKAKYAWNDFYSMFEQIIPKYEKGKGISYYENLLNQSPLANSLSDEQRLLQFLSETVNQYPSPSEYILNIVNSCESSEDNWKSDSLRLRILKQFIKYGDFLTKAGYSSKRFLIQTAIEKGGIYTDTNSILNIIDDSWFSVLNNSSHADKKRNGKYGLLALADDFSRGVLRSQNGSVEPLYLFGIVYDMRFNLISTPENYYRNFEERMFEDFYSCNLTRFFSDSQLPGNTIDSSGRGINYKNPYELIYLFWMDKDLPAQEKLSNAAAMIKQIKNRARPSAECIKLSTIQSRRNVFFLNPVFNLNLLNLHEKEFLCFLEENYCTCSPAGKNIMLTENTQNSAWQTYSNARIELLDLLVQNKDTILNCRYGLCFSETDYESEQKNSDSAAAITSVRTKQLLKKVNKYLQPANDNKILYDPYSFFQPTDMLDYVFKEAGKETNSEVRKLYKKDLTVLHKTRRIRLPEHAPLLSRLIENDRKLPYVLRADGPDNVSRTRLLGLLYYLFNTKEDLNPKLDWQTLRRVFEKFKAFCDPYLIDSYYQPVSEKNVYDLLLIYSSFFRINL